MDAETEACCRRIEERVKAEERSRLGRWRVVPETGRIEERDAEEFLKPSRWRAVPEADLPGWIGLLPAPRDPDEETFLFGRTLFRIRDEVELTVGSYAASTDWGECKAVIREIGDTATPDEISDEIDRRVSEIDAARRALAEHNRRAEHRSRRPWRRAQHWWKSR
jgi:hypothetical protein